MKYFALLLLLASLVACGSPEEPEQTGSHPLIEVSPNEFDDLGTTKNTLGVSVENGGMKTDKNDRVTRFPTGEILLSHLDPAVAEEIADRWDGEVVNVIDLEQTDVPNMYTISVNPLKAPFDHSNQLLTESGTPVLSLTRFSSDAALGTFLIALSENVNHSNQASLNLIFDSY